MVADWRPRQRTSGDDGGGQKGPVNRVSNPTQSWDFQGYDTQIFYPTSKKHGLSGLKKKCWS